MPNDKPKTLIERWEEDSEEGDILPEEELSNSTDIGDDDV